MHHPLPRVRARQIGDADIEAVVELLTRGFAPRRTREYWQQGLDRMAARPPLEGAPKFGYLMESAGVPVGAILLIHAAMRTGTSWSIRCNVSSWYVEPAFRGQAPLLISQALKRRDITYVNMSPARHTRPIVEAQGFTRYSDGQYFALLMPSPFAKSRGTIVTADKIAAAEIAPGGLASHERDLLIDHARFGCISLCACKDGIAYPFVFVPRILKRLVPCVQLIYCRSVDDLADFSRPIGTFLAARGRNLILIDANGPIRGLMGKYVAGLAPKYFRGPAMPRLGDLAYTEAALFGM
jgi:hypothetical protein